jgi:Spy/CpxP family protein refolding chaperone
MKPAYATVILTLVLTFAAAVASAADRPYAGQQTRALKALSDQELADYLQGHGMGLSKVAELNHYPGPRHVLDQAAELGLSPAQLAQAKEIWQAMDAKARALGETIVAKETVLETSFSSGAATPADTRAVLDELARLQADLRYTHLSAHLAMRSVLSAEQVSKYDALRGYSDSAVAPAGHHPMRH